MISAHSLSPHSLSLCSLICSNAVAQEVAQGLAADRYVLVAFQETGKFLQFAQQGKHEIDCLILEDNPELTMVTTGLQQTSTLLPAIVLLASSESQPPEQGFYHGAEVYLPIEQIGQLDGHVEQAIARFLKLVTAPSSLPITSLDPNLLPSLNQQQHRLSEKLKERLGYLGVYYKRDPQGFLRAQPESKRREFLNGLKAEYREIVLHYFDREATINQEIDAFVTRAFFADLSVSQVLELHMELMDGFAKQLKLEGRSEDILLDYRLTLIDVIAHLCEMYRRSIPRES